MLECEELTDVTLVGWSFGGMIITGVADRVPERLAGLVYLDANVPIDGENSYDVDRSSEEVRASDRAAAGLPGFLVVDPYLEWLTSLLPDPADCEWVFSKLVPQPIATYTQPIRLGNPAATAVPRIFVHCTEDSDDAGSPPWPECGQLRAGSSVNWRKPSGAGRRPAGDN